MKTKVSGHVYLLRVVASYTVENKLFKTAKAAKRHMLEILHYPSMMFDRDMRDDDGQRILPMIDKWDFNKKTVLAFDYNGMYWAISKEPIHK